MLSKGSHRLFGRGFTQLAYLTLWGLELAETFSGTFQQMLHSDVLLTFRCLLAIGSFTVLGAFEPTIAERILILTWFIAPLLISVIVREQVSVYNRTFERIDNFSCRINQAVIGVGIVVAIFRFILSFFAIDDDTSSIVSVILRKRTSGKELNRFQQKKLNDMRELVRVQRDTHHRGITNCTYHGQITNWNIRWDFQWASCLDIFAFNISMIYGIITVPYLYRNEHWRFFLLQVTSFFFFLWILVNDSHVENDLFFKLIWISESERP